MICPHFSHKSNMGIHTVTNIPITVTIIVRYILHRIPVIYLHFPWNSWTARFFQSGQHIETRWQPGIDRLKTSGLVGWSFTVFFSWVVGVVVVVVVVVAVAAVAVAVVVAAAAGVTIVPLFK